ncbi:MAG: DUF374 domain-containing protein [Desulfarculaceae bacterium]|nr:DUF374 domain-containing protein [Desulfarculaceae bacterium]MCF8072174.1 DUF374 domain-containing protein [Desulfarculaceae bacterium]MCF8100095.1 DUF374 domain-containing protein [Desulfarculaceae bacterium]MCF8117930.1 DUF374 domain-containing protein [Desulfarculaceae bacterium]
MKKPLLSRYRADEVPLILKPVFYLYGYGIAFLVFAFLLLVRLTSKITIVGQRRLRPRRNHILCFWHSSIFLFFTVFPRNRSHAWLQHPVWYMKTSHVLLRYVGVSKIILGSSGHGGQEAAAKLVQYLRRGYSTVILPDGPAGPAFKLKKGALHISQQSGVPIVPLRFCASPGHAINNWDRRQLPTLFSRITVEVGPAIQVRASNFESCFQALSRFLGPGGRPE